MNLANLHPTREDIPRHKQFAARTAFLLKCCRTGLTLAGGRNVQRQDSPLACTVMPEISTKGMDQAEKGEGQLRDFAPHKLMEALARSRLRAARIRVGITSGAAHL